MENIIKNPEKRRYESLVEDQLIFIEYIETPEQIFLVHTEVPTSLEGKGYGSELVEKTLEQVKQSGKQLVPLCPFVASYIQKNRTWLPMVAPGFKIE